MAAALTLKKYKCSLTYAGDALYKVLILQEAVSMVLVG
jgi:hypothetical protein